MKLALQVIRKAIFDALSGAITLNSNTVPVYGTTPVNASFPFIKVYNGQTDEIDLNQTTFINEYGVNIEVVNMFQFGDGGQLDNDLICSQIAGLVRTRNLFDLSSDGFKLFSITINKIVNLEDYRKDGTYYRTIIEINAKIEQLIP